MDCSHFKSSSHSQYRCYSQRTRWLRQIDFHPRQLVNGAASKFWRRRCYKPINRLEECSHWLHGDGKGKGLRIHCKKLLREVGSLYFIVAIVDVPLETFLDENTPKPIRDALVTRLRRLMRHCLMTRKTLMDFGNTHFIVENQSIICRQALLEKKEKERKERNGNGASQEWRYEGSMSRIRSDSIGINRGIG